MTPTEYSQTLSEWVAIAGWAYARLRTWRGDPIRMNQVFIGRLPTEPELLKMCQSATEGSTLDRQFILEAVVQALGLAVKKEEEAATAAALLLEAWDAARYEIEDACDEMRLPVDLLRRFCVAAAG